MVRIVLYFAGVVLAAAGLSWLADRPGELVINWQGYEIQTSVFRAIVMLGLLVGLAVLVWSILKQVFTSPAVVGHYFRRRRQRKGLEALSAGLIAVGSGDRALASRYALQARKSMPNEPLTHLLRAQTALLMGDKATARRIYESMRNNPETELLGLRGLFIEARDEKETEAARQYAERAVALNPKLGWSVESLFAMQCKEGDWAGALETLSAARKHGHVERVVADRRRAVLLTAQAMALEEEDQARAMALALEAHSLAPDLVPAAAIAGRALASQGATPRAAKVLQRTWKASPHPDLATAYAYARIGDSPRDRLNRVKELAHATPHSDEGPIAVAVAAIEAKEWDEARRALRHLVDDKPAQRVCTLMARIEGGEHGDTGKVREWLARAVHAPRDPAWVADGHVAARWAPISPVTGDLDAYRWVEPTMALEQKDTDLLLEQLMPKPVPVDAALAPPKGAIDGSAIDVEPEVVAPPKSSASPVKVEAQLPAEPVGEPEARAAATVVLTAPTAAPAAAPAPSRAAAAAAPARFGTPTAESPAPAPTRPTEPAPASQPATEATAAPPASPPTSGPPRAPTPREAETSATVVSVDALKRGGARRAPEPRIFVPPRAPDDPGPATGEADDNRAPMTRFRMPQAKDSA